MTTEIPDLPFIVWEEQPWRELAACKGVDPNLFFGNQIEVEIARSICRTCVVQKDCLDWAVREQFQDGVFGGFNPIDRRCVAKGQARVTICGSLEGLAMHRELDEELCPACEARQRLKDQRKEARARKKEKVRQAKQ